MERVAKDERPGVGLLIVVMASLIVAVHVAVNVVGGYGYSRDELYYLACSDHLGAGYVDHPPLSILILALSRLVLGSSLLAIRLPASLAGAAAVAFTGLLARELGGGRRAVFFACLAMLVSPVHLGLTHTFSMNAFEVAFWPASAYVLVRLSRTGRPVDWLLLGTLLGLGLLNKISVLWLAAGIALAVVLVGSLRRRLRTVWPYAAAVLALLLFSPFCVWNALHGFPHLEFMRNIASGKYSSQTPLSFLTGTVMFNHPLTLPLWLGGLAFLLLARGDDPAQRQGRLAVATVFGTTLAILLASYHTKPDYFAPAMALLFAGGGLAVERVLAGKWGRRVAAVYAALLVLGGIASAPFTLPVLPVDSYVAYARLVGIGPSTAEGHRLGDLPQHWADMFGWEQKARDVARVFASLSDADKQKGAIFADNYGRCGAIDFFGPQYGLPRSIGGHNSYWLWGPREYTGELVIVLGGDAEELKGLFESVELAATSSCRHCIPYENDIPVFVCRRSRQPLRALWALTKVYG
jgi:hypothetical protein